MGISKHNLISGLGILNYQLVVECEIGEALESIPDYIVMSTSISIITIHEFQRKLISVTFVTSHRE